MNIFSDQELNDLYKIYVKNYGNKDKEFEAVIYSFGYDEGLEIIKRAKSREIRIVYGVGCDNVNKVIALDKLGNKEIIYKSS